MKSKQTLKCTTGWQFVHYLIQKKYRENQMKRFKEKKMKRKEVDVMMRWKGAGSMVEMLQNELKYMKKIQIKLNLN